MSKITFVLIIIFFQIFNVYAQEEKEIDFEAYDVTKVGQEVPDFSFTTINGNSYKMSELKGKTVLLVFFATWCPPCMKELPQIEKEIWGKFKSKDFMLVALGRDHTMEDIQKFNAKKGFTFPLAPDPEHTIYKKFFTQYIPRNVLVDKDGKIIYQKQGYRETDAKKLIQLIANETK